MLKSLEVTDYVAAVSDFDDTILDNKPTTAGHGLHERSRMDAIRAVGESNALHGLASLPSDVNAVAFYHAPVHSAEGAFWWTLTQAGVVDSTAVFDAKHPVVQQLIAAKSESYRQLLAAEAQEVPGARRFFGQLYDAGFAGRLAIASTGHREDILTFFGSNGFDGFFSPEHIFAKEDTFNPKPDPESFRKAIISMGLTLEDAPRILAFEDDPRGIEAAKSLGMYTCAVTTRYSEGDLMDLPMPPDYVAADFNAYVDVFGL